MLNVSIPSLLDAINSDAEVQMLASEDVEISEKFDGTKLTFLKTGRGNSEWILSYKGNILDPRWFGICPRFEHMYRDSYGVSQYVIVFVKLQNLDLSSVPEGTEVLIEFIQRKSTVLCDYQRYHDLFMIDVRMSDWYIDRTGTKLTTAKRSSVNDLTREHVRSALALLDPPVVFRGKLTSPTSPEAKIVPARPSIKIQTNYWRGTYLNSLYSSLCGFESALGGQAEGVVLRWKSGIFAKVVRADQYNKKARLEKKARFRAPTEKEENCYWDEIRGLAFRILTMSRIPEDIVKSAWEWAETACSLERSHYIRELLKNRNMAIVADDLIMTCKLIGDSLQLVGDSEKIAVFPMAGKPIHDGHWRIIEKAALENDRVIVIASTCARKEITGEQTFYIWREFLEKKLPANIVLRFSDSPYMEAIYTMINLVKNTSCVLTTYGDEDDCERMWNPNIVSKKFGKFKDRVSVNPIVRDSVSGTAMREFLAFGKKDDFISKLPQCLNELERDGIWYYLQGK